MFFMVVFFIKPKKGLKKLYNPFLHKLQFLIIQLCIIKNIKQLYKILIKNLLNTLNPKHFDVVSKSYSVATIMVKSNLTGQRLLKSNILSNFLELTDTEKFFFWYLK